MNRAFYERATVTVARELIGCVITVGDCSGVIVETEAYHESEPACHAFVGVTRRTEPLFGPAGFAYVYRSYGIHVMLNAVTEREGVGAAVLIRALEPVTGIGAMSARRGTEAVGQLCSGPGKLTQAFGIELSDNCSSLADGRMVFSSRPRAWRDPAIAVSRRIGITKAVDLPWRFCAADSRFLSARALD